MRRKGKLGLKSPFNMSGTFTSSTPERAMLDCKTSKSCSPFNPAFVTSAIPSAIAPTCSAVEHSWQVLWSAPRHSGQVKPFFAHDAKNRVPFRGPFPDRRQS